jgi:hypothetical protein
MTDFTIVGQSGRGIGPFLAMRRLEHLHLLARENSSVLLGMFAGVYRHQDMSHLTFSDNPAMHPFVRREVLAHLGLPGSGFCLCTPLLAE